MWPWYAYFVHNALGVDFYNKRFFYDYGSDDADSSLDDSSSSNNKASVTENKTTTMDR